MKEILISGYYGFKNSGDDALLQAIINGLKERGYGESITVLSAMPEQTAATYGVRAINRMNVLSIIRHMKNARLLISGGGTLLQDGTSTKSLLYYISIIKAAQSLGVKTMIYSNGIGPLNKKKNRELTAKTLEAADLITLRDSASEKLLREIGVKNPNVHLSADPVFGLDSSGTGAGRAILSKAGVPEDARIIGISVRDWKDLGSAFYKSVAGAADYAAQKYGLYPVFVPMQAGVDDKACKACAGLMNSAYGISDSRISVEDMLSVTSCMDLCIGMRLHTLIYAASQGIPVIGLVYDPKVSGFMEYVHQEYYTTVEDASTEKLTCLIDRVMENYASIREELEGLRAHMRELSIRNCDYAAELMEKGRADS